jgi:[protein-PII] uridylyltransferase
MTILQRIKKNYEYETKNIVRLHRAGAGGIRVALALTQRLDTLLQTIYQHLENNSRHLTVVALGGYGRKELCFSSDTDVMFLIAEERFRYYSTPTVQEFLHRLLDIGLDVGHSFRTTHECVALVREDIESWMSLIEARYVCGDQETFTKFHTALKQKIQEENRVAFVQRVSEMQHARHKKYGSSSKLLEPNIKNSAGGLRDIHSALWMMRGTGAIPLPKTLRSTETAILHLLKSPLVKQQFTSSFLTELRTAFDTLLRVRNEMHLQSKALHDTLEFSLQPRIASHLRYRAKSKRTQVDRFMQDYYIASKTVALFCSRILDWANHRWPVEASKTKTTKIGSTFILRDGRIHCAKRSIHITNEILLNAFLLRSERRMEFSYALEDAIHRRLHSLRPLKTQTETNLFRLLLHRPNGVANALHKMNDLGLLERWIPEWKPMVSFFQHNQYHFYTADEHTLIVLANAEALEQSSSSFGNVFRSLPRRDTLYLACLFHDIAKPSLLGKHEIKGIPIARRFLQRIMYDDLIDDVSFLVRHHLLMEQIAFRRNLNDPQTIVDFARMFERIEQLDYLYVLTYADLSAVNKNVWTEWKELLLGELYRKARNIMEEQMTSEQVHERSVQQAEATRADILRSLIPEFPPEEVDTHLALFSDTSYLAMFKPEEIAQHLQAIRTDDQATVLFQQSGSFTEVTFISRDSPGVLSKFCGVLTANDANIFDAQVFTRRDGIVIDKFRVVEFSSHIPLSEELCERISHNIKEVSEGRVEISKLIERHRMRWKRRTQPMNLNVRCDVEFEDHPKFTIIDVYAPDTLGFLYRLTETISRLGLNITFAKISTRIDGIVDSFYLLDTDGKKLDNLERREQAKQEILTTIRSLSESELVPSTIT